MNRLSHYLLAGASALALTSPSSAQQTVPQAGDSYFQAARAQLEEKLAVTPNTNAAKNIILFVGDGMSIPTITAGRIYEGQSRGVDGESNNLTMDTFPYSALVEDLHATTRRSPTPRRPRPP